MEQPKSETEQSSQTPIQDPNPKPDPKETSHSPNGDGKWTSFVMASESQNEIQTQTEPSTTPTASRKSVHWSPELVTESSAMSSPHGSNNPYVSPSPASSSSFSFKGKLFSLLCVYLLDLSTWIIWYLLIFFWADSMDSVRNVLGRWGKKVGEATKKAEDLAGNTWQHCKFLRVLLNSMWDLNNFYLLWRCSLWFCVELAAWLSCLII